MLPFCAAGLRGGAAMARGTTATSPFQPKLLLLLPCLLPLLLFQLLPLLLPWLVVAAVVAEAPAMRAPDSQ